MSSLPAIERHGAILVVRDDAFPGGTKARVLPSILEGGREYVYASPVYGYAQIALAYACREIGSRATVFVAKRKRPHPRTLEALRAGAKILQVSPGYMTVTAARARAYCEARGATLLPFGMDIPEMQAGICDIAKRIDIDPTHVLTVAGSGTLTRALQAAWPGARFDAIRIGSVPDPGTAAVWLAPERFEQDARNPPPFPSCSNYDAKAWQFLTPGHPLAWPGTLFWNVAG